MYTESVYHDVVLVSSSLRVNMFHAQLKELYGFVLTPPALMSTHVDTPGK